MSFANEVKKEICRRTSGARHCLLAEAAAIFLKSGCLVRENSRVCLCLETDQYLVAERFLYLIQEAFGCRMQIRVRARHTGNRKKYLLQLENQRDVLRILQALKLERQDG